MPTTELTSYSNTQTAAPVRSTPTDCNTPLPQPRVAAAWWQLSAGLALALLALTAPPARADSAPAPSYASFFDRLPCVNRVGRCFDATVGGEPVVVIERKADYESLQASLPSGTTRFREVYWQVQQPVDGAKALEVATSANDFGRKHVGEENEEPDVTVYPLDGQQLESRAELTTQPSVRIQGQPVVTQQNTLTDDRLPPGRYVMAIKFIGAENWDRKWVLLTVR